MTTCIGYKVHKEFIVVQPYAVVEPLAMVIHLQPACLTLSTVVSSFRFEGYAILTKPSALLIDELKFSPKI